MKTSIAVVGAVLCLATIISGCDSGGLPGEGLIIRATLDESSVVAGTVVNVTCQTFDGEKGTPTTDAIVTVTPADGATVDGEKIQTATAGEFKVECRSESLTAAVSEPADLMVTPAGAARTRASLDPENVAAGEPSTVTCTVEDAFGNVIEDTTSQPEKSDDFHVDGYQVSTDVTGAYEVFCSAPDGFPDVEKVPAILQVTPGRPVTLTMTLTPDKKNYKIKDVVTISWIVVDAYGNLIDDLPADILIAPEEGLPLKGSKVTFEQEGKWTVTVSLKDFILSDSQVVFCDWSAPVLEIEWPPRGTTIDGSPEVEVRGTVHDAAGSNVTVDINGKTAKMAPGGKFSLPLTSRHGLNGLKITAKDSKDFEIWTTRGFYWSDTWTPIDDETSMEDMTRDDGAMLFLGQKFLDDGDHDPTRPNDLATILEVILSSNVGGLLNNLPPFSIPIPNIINLTLLGIGLQGDLEIEVQVTDITFGEPYVAITTRDGGIATSVTLEPVSVSLELKFVLHARAIAFGNTYQLLDPTTTAGSYMEIGTFGVGLSLDIEKQAGSEIQVEGKDFNLDILDIQIDPISHLEIDLGVVPGLGINLGKIDLTRLVGNIDNLLMDFLVEPLINFIIPPITNLLEPLITGIIGDALKSLIGMLVIDQAIDLPALSPTSPTASLGLHLAPSTVIFTEDGGTVGLELGFLAADESGHTPIGIIGSATADATQSFSFAKDPGVQVGLDIQTINSLLFMMWRSGWLKGQIDLSSLVEGIGFGVGNLKITPDMYLPPIINDIGMLGEDGMLSLEIGDAYLKVQVDVIGNPQFFDLWLQMAIEVQIVAEGNEIGVKLGKITFFEAEFVNLGDLGDLFGMFLPSIPDLIKGLENQKLTFPIPEIDLGSIIPGLGGPAVVQLGNGISDVRDGTIVFGVDLL